MRTEPIPVRPEDARKPRHPCARGGTFLFYPARWIVEKGAVIIRFEPLQTRPPVVRIRPA